ncbi:MAG: MlaC/ttg2D family ABC transporter substrate-binding protein [Bdellovibrionales bacterium]
MTITNNKTLMTLSFLSVLSFPYSAQAVTAFDATANNKASETHFVSTSKEEGAKTFVKKMTDNGLQFLSDTTLSKEQKASAFAKLLNSNFDIDAIGKFALGRYWREMSSAQQNEYQKLFKTMLVNVYSKRFDEYQGQSVEIKESVSLSEKDTLVKSVIVDPKGGSDVPVDWRIRHKNGTYKVIDVLVAGVSMSVTQRSDFSSVIQRGGGKADVIIEHLKK